VSVSGKRVQEQRAGPPGMGPGVRAQPDAVTAHLARDTAGGRIAGYQGRIAGR